MIRHRGTHQVWHATARGYRFEEHDAWDRDNWTHVADVEATGLEEVFARTNHVDSAWTDGPLVTVFSDPDRTRSTSVGDVVVDPDGVAHMCCNMGWKIVEVGGR